MHVQDIPTAYEVFDAVSENLKVSILPEGEEVAFTAELRRIEGNDLDTAMVVFSDNFTTRKMLLSEMVSRRQVGAVAFWK